MASDVHVIAAPLYDMGHQVVDQPVDTALNLAWQVQLTGFHTRDTRLDTVSGSAVVTSPEHGVLRLGADAPDPESAAGRWPGRFRVVGAGSGQMMVIDPSATVYRLAPGREPARVWEGTYHPDDVSVDGLPDGQLLVSSFDDWTSSEIELVEEASGDVVWRSRVVSPVLPVGDQLIGKGGREGRDLVSLDVRTGAERWRTPGAFSLGPRSLIAVVGGVLWADESIDNRLVGWTVDTGRPVEPIQLPRESRMTGVLDQAGHLHIGDEHGWLVVDLLHARVASDVRFEHADIGAVLAQRTVHSADGRLVLADSQGRIFAAHPGRPARPELVATCPQVQGIGITAGKVIVMSYDGTLTALGTSS